MIVYDTNGEQPLSAMISMITKVSMLRSHLWRVKNKVMSLKPLILTRNDIVFRTTQVLLHVLMRLVMGLRMETMSLSLRFRV